MNDIKAIVPAQMEPVLISSWKKIGGNVIRTQAVCSLGLGLMVGSVAGECIKTQICLGEPGSKRDMYSASLSTGWCETTDLSGQTCV